MFLLNRQLHWSGQTYFQSGHSSGFNKAKKYKTLGDDSIPVETLCIGLLHELCNQCFDNSMATGAWRRGIVTPIPKSCASDLSVLCLYVEVRKSLCVNNKCGVRVEQLLTGSMLTAVLNRDVF